MTRVEQWERRTEVPLLLLALAFLGAYAWPILDPEIDRDLKDLLSIASWTVWSAFPGANITTFGDALWWATATSTTVGYGDYYPVTTEGRLIAVGLMLVGIALLGSITAAIASWFVASAAAAEEEEVEEVMDESTAAILASLDDLKQQVAALEARLHARD